MQRKRDNLETSGGGVVFKLSSFEREKCMCFFKEAVSKRTKEAEQDRLLARESSNKEDKGSPYVPKLSRVAKISVSKPCLKGTNVEYSAVMG